MLDDLRWKRRIRKARVAADYEQRSNGMYYSWEGRPDKHDAFTALMKLEGEYDAWLAIHRPDHPRLEKTRQAALDYEQKLAARDAIDRRWIDEREAQDKRAEDDGGPAPPG